MESAAVKLSEVQISTEGKKSTGRRDHLVDIQKRIQKKWDDAKVNESTPDLSKKKYMCTFPYPYMNGFLHIGHGFSASKVEFASRYHRLKGENVLFPFGLHCTGMPIQAAANKLKRELEIYGCPPQFENAEVAEKASNSRDQTENKAKGKKTKLAAKTGKAVHQWDIMKMMVPEEEIPKFIDPLYWLKYFPPHAKEDLMALGMNIDWRRTFITTDANPYYDAFIRWQLNVLNQRGRVKRGKRPNVFSTIDQQICADHDRSSGEGVNPQEYTIIKLEVLSLNDKMSSLEGKKVYLSPATLRPETMHGQTNCFVLPDGDYGAFILNDEPEVYIMSRRAAKNLAHQEKSRVWGKEECVLELKGYDLLGLPLKAPNATFDVIYTLPLLTISMGKGTGVVTSVPSDAPDDYAALRDLKEKKNMREKFNLTDEMVLPYDVVPIIDIPGFGDKAAVTICDQLKIKSQNDKEKLAQAKEQVYTKGFYEGVMLVGSQKGKKVCDAKPLVRQELVDMGLAFPYWETESRVVSRSGDECVVAHLDQWYLTYGDNDWKERVLNHVKNPDTFTAYNPIALTEYITTLGWLREWAPCRQFGLGTKLPWDPQFVVESLSDSTIYMAYYTIAHHLQANFDGSKPGPLGIKPESLTDEVFNYIFCRGKYPSGCDISEDTLNLLRGEFEYWYPVDLRGSGKDLIRNHLTMSLYNHAEVFRHDPKLWPRSFFTNGHVLVDAEKMSKSKGNFLSIKFCAEEIGADAARFSLADAGDGMDDANFSRDTANMAILRLTTEEEWIKKIISDKADGNLRTGALDFNDRVFLEKMNQLISLTEKNFDNMQWRDGLQSGFFEYQIARDTYRDICARSEVPMHQDVILRFIESQVIMLSPICPHICEHIWEVLGKPGMIVQASWPEHSTPDFSLLQAGEFLNKSLKGFRDTLIKNSQPKKGKKAPQVQATPQKPTHAHVYVATEFPLWQQTVLKFMATVFDKSNNSFPSDFMKQLKNVITADDTLKKMMKNVMQFAAFVRADSEVRGFEALALNMPFDQVDVLNTNKVYLLKSLELQDIKVLHATKTEEPNVDLKKMETASPGKPSIYLFSQ